MAGMDLTCFTLEQQRILVMIIGDMTLLQAKVDALMRNSDLRWCPTCGYYKPAIEMDKVGCKECELRNIKDD